MLIPTETGLILKWIGRVWTGMPVTSAFRNPPLLLSGQRIHLYQCHFPVVVFLTNLLRSATVNPTTGLLGLISLNKKWSYCRGERGYLGQISHLIDYFEIYYDLTKKFMKV
jgi:hypothetical protein